MSVFLDANVLLEVLLPGRPKTEIADTYVQKESIVSPLSAHLYTYFGTKEGYPIKALTRQLTLLKYTELGVGEINWAIANCQDNDFEDALQVACAVLNGSELFVTLDKNLAQKYQQFINIKLL